MSSQGGKGGGAVQAPNLNSGGGKGILPLAQCLLKI